MSEHDDDKLRELGKQLPWHRPDDATRDAVREAVLAAAEREHARGRVRWGFVAGAFGVGALAAAIAMILFAREGGEESRATQARTGGTPTLTLTPTPTHAEIQASTAADFERQVTGEQEVVRVKAGKLRVAADPHVRVATSDAVVEGDGTYEVVVSGDRIRQVDVVTAKTGKIAVRVTGQQAVFLAAGESWHAREVAVSEDIAEGPRASGSGPPEIGPRASGLGPPEKAPVVEKPVATHVASHTPAEPRIVQNDTNVEPKSPEARSPRPEALPAPDPRKLTEGHFQTGYQLLKAGKDAEAARELGAAADAGGDLAGDARYFQAIALARAGRKTEAERALVQFLDQAPQSIRRGRAAVMLGRLIAERGDSKAARAWFESALHDADPEVAAAAQAGIAGLH